jgi:AcrR family transcriptional regulator
MNTKRDSMLKANEPCKKRDREASTRKLFNAGLKIFSKYGYDAATTKLISKEAGINESLINRYYEGKSGLLLAITREFFNSESECGVLSGYPNGDTLEKEIYNFLIKMFNHHEKMQSFLKVVFSRAIVDRKVRDEMKKNTQKGGIPALLTRLKVFQASGEISSEVNLQRACFTITTTAFAISFFGHIVMGQERNFVLKTLADFSKNYAVALRTRLDS